MVHEWVYKGQRKRAWWVEGHYDLDGRWHPCKPHLHVINVH